MLARPTLIKRPDATTTENPKGQARPVEERFLFAWMVRQSVRSAARTGKNCGHCGKEGLSRGDGHDCR